MIGQSLKLIHHRESPPGRQCFSDARGLTILHYKVVDDSFNNLSLALSPEQSDSLFVGAGSKPAPRVSVKPGRVMNPPLIGLNEQKEGAFSRVSTSFPRYTDPWNA